LTDIAGPNVAIGVGEKGISSAGVVTGFSGQGSGGLKLGAGKGKRRKKEAVDHRQKQERLNLGECTQNDPRAFRRLGDDGLTLSTHKLFFCLSPGRAKAPKLRSACGEVFVPCDWAGF